MHFSLNQNEKSETCIFGTATPRKHNIPAQPKSRAKKRAWVYKMINSKYDPAKINKTRTSEATTLVGGKTISVYIPFWFNSKSNLDHFITP
jgi:hypothetical protein